MGIWEQSEDIFPFSQVVLEQIISLQYLCSLHFHLGRPRHVLDAHDPASFSLRELRPGPHVLFLCLRAHPHATTDPAAAHHCPHIPRLRHRRSPPPSDLPLSRPPTDSTQTRHGEEEEEEGVAGPSRRVERHVVTPSRGVEFPFSFWKNIICSWAIFTSMHLLNMDDSIQI
jgi:hypothetical protein